MRRALATWAAVVIPIWITMILCTHWEPVQRDGWGHLIWQRHTGLSVDNLIEFARGTYTHNNPRLGQVVTLLMFTPGPWHVIFTPLLELATFYLLVALVIGRVPRTVDDAYLFLVTFAITAVTAPQFGLLMFYRPYTGNYVFGWCVSLLFLVAYRTERGRWPVMIVLGFATGLCNEHTGPTVVALAVAATYLTWRNDRRVHIWQLVGIVAMIAGGLALWFAPGQHIRYNGIGQHTLLDTLTDRGASGTLYIVGVFAFYLLPALAWLALSLYKPRRLTTPELALLVGAVAIVLTLLLSPKVGPRLYFASCSLVAGVLASFGRQRLYVTIGSALVAAFVCVRCVVAYHAVGEIWATRTAAWERGETPDLTPYSTHRSRWILDDDMALPEYRAQAAAAFILPR